MRASSRLGTLALGLLTTAALLAGCTGGDDGDSGDPGADAAATSSSGVEGAAPTTDWFCQYIEKETVDLATDGQAATSREAVRQDDAEQYVCEVLDPDGGVALRLTVAPDGAAQGERMLAKAQESDEVRDGPDYLGRSLVSPGIAVATMPCGAPPAAEQQTEDEQVPYTFALEGVNGPAAAMTDQLTTPLNRLVQDIDRAMGCSPSEARASQDAGSSTAP